jgi:hypothetical protein
LAPAYPDWEPDALYAAFRVAREDLRRPCSAWVDLNLRRSLEDMGHELVRFNFPLADAADRTGSVGKLRTNERLLATFRRPAPRPRRSLHGYFYSSVVYPETID